jgi:tetratricopeptide (TPR) repeat protein
MNNWIRFIALFSLALSSNFAWADARQDGDAAFAKGDFPAAARAYQTALSAGPQSAGLYYNLAVAQTKAGDRPQAALSLRRALMLDPGLTDARVSLSEIERSEGVTAVKESWQTKLLEHVPLAGLFITGAVFFWAGAFVLLMGIFGKQTFAPTLAGVIVTVLGAALFAVGVLADPKISDRSAGVIVSGDAVNLLSAPADQSPSLTKLPPAACVKVIRQSGAWTYCQAPGGEKGWLPTSALQSVVPVT